MASRLRMTLLAITASVLMPGAVSAADFPPTPSSYYGSAFAPASPYGALSEVRGGLFYHGYDSNEAGSVDVNAELISPRVLETDTGAWNYLIPRLHLGGNLNTIGKTSDVYTGLTWSFPIFRRLFGEITLGGSYNDGHTGLDGHVPVGYSPLGCHLMFRESVSLGYRLTEHWSFIATAEHISNDHLCTRNAGVTNFGGRLGYVF